MEKQALWNMRSPMNLIPIINLVTLLTTSVAASNNLDSPPDLRKMEETRLALETGRIEWKRTQYRSNHEARTTYHSSRFAVDDVYNTNRGDMEGVIVRDEQGGFSRPEDLRPRQSLLKGGEIFYYDQGDTDAESFPARDGGIAGTVDMRSLGLSSRLERQPVTEALWGSLAMSFAVQYEISSDGPYKLIVAKSDTGTKKWWLDPNRDGIPIRVAWFDKQGVLRSECRSEYNQYDGIWFPSRVEFFESRFRDGREPAEIVEIVSAEFNQSEHPRSFTLSDLGVEPGVRITRNARPGQPLEEVHWDGKQIISHDEFMSRLRSGELKEGPNFEREIARIKAVYEEYQRTGEVVGGGEISPDSAHRRAPRAVAGPGQTVSEWEAYVRSFIARYQLHSDQEQKALDILRSCQDRATKYAATKTAEFERVVRNRNGAKQLPIEKRSEIVNAADQELAMLMQPITEIFESDLRPRLERIPTRVQRNAAEARTTDRSTISSQPASPK